MNSMKSKMKLNTIDDLFAVSNSDQGANREKIREIPLSSLHSFAHHPFQVRDDVDMQELVDSIREQGVLIPVIVRPMPADRGEEYELIAGHRRKHACELLGLGTIPAIVQDLDDDAATIVMVDSNLQREELLPSERAFAYRMKMDAMKRQGARTDLTSGQKVSSVEEIAQDAGESRKQIQRFIRLTELIPELLDRVDEKKIPLNSAYNLSFMKPEDQKMVAEILKTTDSSVSLAQAVQLRGSSQDGSFSFDIAYSALCSKPAPPVRITIKEKKIRQYFPESYSQKQMEEVIFSLLEKWKAQNDESGVKE